MYFHTFNLLSCFFYSNYFNYKERMDSINHDRKHDDDHLSTDEDSKNQLINEKKKITTHHSSSHYYHNYLPMPVQPTSQPPSNTVCSICISDNFQNTTSLHSNFSCFHEVCIPPPFLEDPNSNIPTPRYLKYRNHNLKENIGNKDSSLFSSDSSFYLEFSSPHSNQTDSNHSRSIFNTSSLKLSKHRSSRCHSRDNHNSIFH